MLGALVCPSRVWAHRLDELLQATQVTIGEDHVVVNVYLTPGILVAPSFDRTIDRDGNGVVDDREASMFAASVLQQLRVSVDSVTVPLALAASHVPPLEQLTQGTGTIELSATGRLPPRQTGDHRLRLENGFQPERSVYLANVLRSESPRIAIKLQRRDPLQRSLDVEYEIVPSSLLLRMAAAGMVVAAVVVLWIRRRFAVP